MSATIVKTTVEATIYGMLTESTGASLCDSGGAYGRHWERNQLKTLEDFKNAPEVTWDGYSYTINVFHYLMKCGGLELDSFCHDFNSKDVEDWDGDYYGVSKAGQAWLDNYEFTSDRSWNTYNHESSLSQVLQGTELERDGEKYLLLQIHQGCDVRGGYTDAKLFKLEYGYMGGEDVCGCVLRPDGKVILVDNMYNGHSLTDENGNEVEIGEEDKVEVSLIEFCG